MPAALRTYLLVNSPNASDWTAMRRSIQSYLLATASTPKPVPMDVGYIPKGGKGKEGKNKKGQGKGGKDGWWSKGSKGKPKGEKGQGKGGGTHASGSKGDTYFA
eukprot:3217895-Amphidinium_carterae.1